MYKRIGFACKYMHPDQTQKKKLLEEIQRPLNTRCTTVRWLNNQTRDVAEQRLWDLMVPISHLYESYYIRRRITQMSSMVHWVAMCFRLYPAYLELLLAQADVVAYCEKEFARVASKSPMSIIYAPGLTYCSMSDNEEIVERSIEEFEYHTIIRWKGYGRTFQDFKCNVHISGRQGPAGIKHAVNKRLSPEARNTITIENDENKWGLDASLELVDTCALVLDIHHHWCREGEYIKRTDDRFTRVIDSWRGVRPVIHYSVSREDILADHNPELLPNMKNLLEQGYKKAKLRAHSDYMWNNAVNDWALSFLQDADIMVESKAKNLASIALHKYLTEGEVWQDIKHPQANQSQRTTKELLTA